MARTVRRLTLAVFGVVVTVGATAPVAVAQGTAGGTLLALDFDLYRESVEPILLSRRPGNARCVVCHSRGGGNAFLEPLSPGSETYDEEQSFRNFERIQRLVVPGEPFRSVLLTNPLAEEAGGSHWHGGGKHWSVQSDEEWQTLARWVNTTTSALDFDFYRDEVEPVLLSRRPGNARCVVCHSRGGGNAYLEPLSPGSETLRRGAVAPQLRSDPASGGAGRAAPERAPRLSAGRGGRREPLAWRGQALVLAKCGRVADTGALGPGRDSRGREIAKLRLDPTSAVESSFAAGRCSEPRYAGARHLQVWRQLASNVARSPSGDV